MENITFEHLVTALSNNTTDLTRKHILGEHLSSYSDVWHIENEQKSKKKI